MDFQMIAGKTIELFFISVPEQVFLVLFVMMLANQYELIFPLKKDQIKNISILSLIPALVSILLRTAGGLDMNVTPLIGIAVFTVAFAVVYGVKEAKKIARILLFVIVGFITVMVIQMTFLPFILYGTSITIDSFNEPSLVTLLWTLPERFIELIILSGLFASKNSVNKVKVMRFILQNRFFTIVFFLLLAINLFTIYTFSINVYIDKVLIGLKPLSQVSIIICVILFILLNLFVFFITAFFVADRKSNDQTFIKQEALVLKALIDLKLREGKYFEIHGILDDFSLLVEDTNKYMYRKGLKV